MELLRFRFNTAIARRNDPAFDYKTFFKHPTSQSAKDSLEACKRQLKAAKENKWLNGNEAGNIEEGVGWYVGQLELFVRYLEEQGK